MNTETTKIDDYFNWFIAKLVNYVPNLIGAFIILVIGVVAIKIFRRVISNLMKKRPDHDPTLLKFVLDVVTWILRAFLLVAIINKLGIDTASFAAAIAAAGLAIGLSLQGSLSNFAGGLLIILFKPFRIGDYIEAQGQSGTVNSIQIFSTRIITPNNQVIYMPNGALSNNTIKNYSQEPLRRAEIVLSVGYGSNLKEVKDVIYGVIKADTRILTKPAPGIEVRALAESSVDVAVYMWSERANFGPVVSDFYENIKSAFDTAGIEIPYPHRDIKVIQPDGRENTPH